MGARLQDPETQLMKCIVCRHGETRPGTTTVTFHRDGRTLVVNEVPAEVCENCGEAYIAEDVTAQLLAIADEAGTARATVLVRDFAPAAA
jgi:YgiT-type zinc finger domain-containing protein